MELCADCRKLILKADLVWVVVQTCKRTHWSPAEYDELPFHRACTEPQQDAAEARAEAKYRDLYGSEL
jgi:hypothetical protein